MKKKVLIGLVALFPSAAVWFACEVEQPAPRSVPAVALAVGIPNSRPGSESPSSDAKSAGREVPVDGPNLPARAEGSPPSRRAPLTVAFAGAGSVAGGLSTAGQRPPSPPGDLVQLAHDEARRIADDDLRRATTANILIGLAQIRAIEDLRAEVRAGTAR